MQQLVEYSVSFQINPVSPAVVENSSHFSDSQNENPTIEDNENTTARAQKGEREVQPKSKAKSDIRKRQREEDPRIDEAYSVLKHTLAQKPRDESSVFGEHVANKHRKYNSQIRSIVEHKINNILFEADMGYLSQNCYQQVSQSPHESTSSGSVYIEIPASSSQTQTFHSLTSDNSTSFDLSTPFPSTQHLNNSTTQDESQPHTKNILQLVAEFTGE